MLCQVSTSSIRVKLRHQWDQRRGFDSSSPFPPFIWDVLEAANFCMQLCFIEQIRTIVVKAIHWSHAFARTFQGLPSVNMHLSVCIKTKVFISALGSALNILKQLFKRLRML